MKKLTYSIAILLCIVLIIPGCGASKTVKGGAIGGGSGAILGAGIGSIFGGKKGAAWGAAIGAVVGGSAGAAIGHKMDKQKAELEKIKGAKVESINNGEAIRVTFESGILFATNSSSLNTSSKVSLDKFAQSLKTNPDTDVEIYGYTDSTGNDGINIPLSEKRAESVYNFLLNGGVTSPRMMFKGFGSQNPVASNNTKIGRSQNRRVEVYILPNQKMVQEAKAGQLK